MRAVNLLPSDIRARRRVDPLPVAAAGASAVVVVALAMGFLIASGPVSTKQDAIADVEAQLGLVAAQPPPEGAAEEVALAAEQELRSTALEAALASRVSWDRVLRRFSLVLPDDVWLTALSATGSGAEEATTLFQIQGYTYSHDGVARLLARLAVVPDLENVQLQQSALVPLEGRNVVQFSIAAAIRRGVRS